MEHPMPNGEVVMNQRQLYFADPKNCSRRRFGFTLVELMVVMAIIAVLMSIAVPIYTRSIQRSKESVLKNNLFTLRTVIDEYTYDKTEGAANAARPGERRLSAAGARRSDDRQRGFLEADHGRRHQHREPDSARNLRCAERIGRH